MNFKINNNASFGAHLSINGKQLATETDKIYQTTVELLERNRRIATQSQEYIASAHIQKAIDCLPGDTFVRLNTGILDGESKRADKILGFVPFLSFETKSINEQINLSKQLGSSGDILKLSLDKTGKLNTDEIDNWLDNLLRFYQKK